MNKPKNLSLRNSKNAKIGLKDLCAYVKENSTIPIKKIVEIGSFSGDSGLIFSEEFEHLTSIDQWKSGYDNTNFDLASNFSLYDMAEVEKEFDKQVGYKDNVHKIKSSSVEASQKFDNETFDMVYIDALHTYEGLKSDIMAWFNKIKKGGYLAGHDAFSKFPGVTKLIMEVFGEPDQTFSDTSYCYKVTDELIEKFNTRVKNYD
jgi:predicted O-methyltransferase YrrM